MSTVTTCILAIGWTCTAVAVVIAIWGAFDAQVGWETWGLGVAGLFTILAVIWSVLMILDSIFG